jgi:hypothetical protein
MKKLVGQFVCRDAPGIGAPLLQGFPAFVA